MRDPNAETQTGESVQERQRERNYTSDGRYIPYSGGTAGWDDNNGVPRVEQSNNYAYHTVMDSDEVRVTQFIRMGERYDRRGNRVRVMKEVPITMRWDGGEVSGSTRDLSLQGMRIQFVEQVPLSQGDKAEVDLHNADGSTLITLPVRVVWAHVLGNLRPLWNIGMTFLETTPEQTATLRETLGL